MELVVALLFGALIAATDPVAVVSLFKELGAPVRLMTLVEGESLFNDATAIVLFHILLGIVATASGFGVADVGPAVVEFFRVFFGGIAVGAVVGFGISELMRRIDSGHMAILVMSLVMAYVSFVTAEHLLHVSGVMAAVSAALAMGAYGVTRIPPSAMKLTYETWEVIALICNSLLFLMVGLSVDIGVVSDLFLEIIVVAILVIAARALSVYTFVPTTTRLFKLPMVNTGERHIMWWGGLKGGLAIAIVLSIPEDLPGKQFLVQLTLGVVMFTLLVNAPTIRPLIRFLGIDRLTEEEQAELRRGLLAGKSEAHGMLDSLHAAELISAGSYTALTERLQDTFEAEPAENVTRVGLRHAHLEALRIELDELEHLFDIGLIKEYTYLDLRATLRRDREHWMDSGAQEADDLSALNPFQRLEQSLIRRLREANWAARLLAFYQGVRISHSVCSAISPASLPPASWSNRSTIIRDWMPNIAVTSRRSTAVAATGADRASSKSIANFPVSTRISSNAYMREPRSRMHCTKSRKSIIAAISALKHSCCSSGASKKHCTGCRRCARPRPN